MIGVVELARIAVKPMLWMYPSLFVIPIREIPHLTIYFQPGDEVV